MFHLLGSSILLKALIHESLLKNNIYNIYGFWLVRTNEQGTPEFPSWIILPLFLMITLSAIVFKKRLFNPLSEKRNVYAHVYKTI